VVTVTSMTMMGVAQPVPVFLMRAKRMRARIIPNKPVRAVIRPVKPPRVVLSDG